MLDVQLCGWRGHPQLHPAGAGAGAGRSLKPSSALRMRRVQNEMLTPVSNKHPQPSIQSEEGGYGASKGAAASCPAVPAALLDPWLCCPDYLLKTLLLDGGPGHCLISRT